MTKRKSNNDSTTLPRKRARLAPLHDTPDCQTCDVLTAPSPPLSLATPARLEKRKRTRPDLSQADPSEESKPKRSRTSHSPSDLTRRSRSSSPEPWPSIGYIPEEERKPNPLVEAFHRAWIDAEPTCSCQPQTVYRNPLPSPVPSDRGASEPDRDEFTIISVTPQTQYSTSKPRKSLSPNPQQAPLSNPSPPRRKRRNSRRQIGKHSPASSHERQPQQQSRKTRNSHQDQPQDENSPPLIENFIHSRRSSRRNPVCELWYLSDNGIACAVTSNR